VIREDLLRAVAEEDTALAGLSRFCVVFLTGVGDTLLTRETGAVIGVFSFRPTLADAD